LVVRQIVEQLADDGLTIIVVMHSYGGMVGLNALEDLDVQSRAAQGKSGGVAHLIAIAAMIYPKGYDSFDIAREMGVSDMLSWVEFDEDGSNDIKDPKFSCYADVSEEEADVVIKTLSRLDRMSAEHKVKYEAWRVIPLTYILTLQDVIFPVDHQRFLLKKLEEAGHKADVKTFDSSHSPFLSKIPETVKVIEDVADSLRSR
jgi:pimeloyl-ACP methyl ester carboxylesterase